jgi:hypothetical protein
MRDLFGHEAPRAGRQRPGRPGVGNGPVGNGPVVAATRCAPARPEPVEQQKVDLPTPAVESFGALRAAVCLSSAVVGTVWLVREYTAELRPEISAADLMRLVATLQVFPGARVARFESLHINTPTVASAQAPTSSWTSPEARNE